MNLPARRVARARRLQALIAASLVHELSRHWRVSLDCDQTRFKVYTTHGSLRLLGASVHCVF